METGDVLLLGAVGVGGFLAWRWYKGLPVANAQKNAPRSVAGIQASSMTATAARTTLWGGPILSKRIFAPRLPVAPVSPKLPAPTAAPSAVLVPQAQKFEAAAAKVLAAVFAPIPTAPSSVDQRFVTTGVLQSPGTSPAGEGKIPGDPSNFTVLQTRGIL